jgi:hypothetical protein
MPAAAAGLQPWPHQTRTFRLLCASLLRPCSFEWAVCDVSDKTQVQEVYELLSLNYVEDDDAMFRCGAGHGAGLGAQMPTGAGRL